MDKITQGVYIEWAEEIMMIAPWRRPVFEGTIEIEKEYSDIWGEPEKNGGVKRRFSFI